MRPERYISSIFVTMPMAVCFVISCKQPFVPPETRGGNSTLLVVDGHLTAGNDSSVITLSHARSLTDSVTYYPELHATLSVIGVSSGENFSLNEMDSGRYGAASLNLVSGRQYKLQIITANGKKYLSDPIDVIETPPIDSVSWNQDTTSSSNKRGITIYASTHDPNNNTRYYQWKYQETWEYHAAWESLFLLLLPSYQVVPRNSDQFTYTCFRDFHSTELKLATSENLSDDQIYKTPLVFIPQGDEKLGVRYRILVKQYGLARQSYEYWQGLKKNTELTGTIFDPQPSQQNGNLHCTTNPGEVVLGYVDASTVQQQFIFIKSVETEHWGYSVPGDCPLVIGNFAVVTFRAMGLRPVYQVFSGGYACTFPSCIDCTARGGTTQRPSFW